MVTPKVLGMAVKHPFSPLRRLRYLLESRPVLLGGITPSSANHLVRHSSHGPPARSHTPGRTNINIKTLRALYERGDPITVLTAHDFPSGYVADTAGIEVILVGDSLAMVALGMEDTNQVTMEEMLTHCRSVSRAVKHGFMIADLPMGSYEVSYEQAVESAIRMAKEGGAKAVKLEGGEEMAPTIQQITRAGVPVMAHIGLTPQRQHSLGGFKVQAKSVAGAVKLLRDAISVQEAGAFMILIEAVPAEIAALVTKRLRVPTIGIGSGNGCSGQVLVQVDMTGNFPPGRFVPKFVKTYADIWGESLRGIEAYKHDVKSRAFPSPDYTYPISDGELKEFKSLVENIPDGGEGRIEYPC